MDALSSILEVIRLEGMVCSKSVLKGSWGLDIIQESNAQFWRVIKGRCVIGINNEIISMNEGDIAFIPHGAAHWVADSPASRRITLSEFRKTGLHMEGEETILAVGHINFDEEQKHPFLRDLPPVIHIASYGTRHHQFLQHTAYVLVTELNEEKPGGHVMLKSLAEMLFVSIIRAYIEESVPEKGFLAALNDAHISKALKLMQDDPSRDWTLQSLAKSVAMSRSVFAGRFKSLVGETPLTYLTNWRINRAKEILMSANVSIDEVALKVGYQSEAAFNRVFKARTGKTPAIYRRTWNQN